jgi:probable rRNA maturation factor
LRANTKLHKQKPASVDLPSAQTLARFLKSAQAAVGLKGQVTVLLTTDEAIRGLNKRFRAKNKATDVLSFPAEGANRGSGAERIAGDLAISVTTALRQAKEQEHPLWTEIKVLILHGLLHLAGFDHEIDDGKMARREGLLRGKLRLPQGLIERVGFPTFSPEKQDAGPSTPLRSAQDDRARGAGEPSQGLRPKGSSSSQSARLKTRPFKMGSLAAGSSATGSLAGSRNRAAKAKRP